MNGTYLLKDGTQISIVADLKKGRVVVNHEKGEEYGDALRFGGNGYVTLVDHGVFVRTWFVEMSAVDEFVIPLTC